MEKKLVGGENLYTDSTHVRAKANKHEKLTVTIEKSPKANRDKLSSTITADREALGKKPFDRKGDDEPPTGQISRVGVTQKADNCTKKESRMDSTPVSIVPLAVKTTLCQCTYHACQHQRM